MSKTKRVISSLQPTSFKRPLVLIVAACLLLAAVTLMPRFFGDNAVSLPAKYANLDKSIPSGIGPYYFNGIDPGEGITNLSRGQTVQLRVDSVFGQDIYVVLGDPPNDVILKTIRPRTGTIDTTIVIPKDLKVNNKFGLVPLYIYYTIIDGELKSDFIYLHINQ